MCLGVLYALMFATIIAGFVYVMGWAVPLAPLQVGIQGAIGTVGRIIGVDSPDVRPWVILALTAAAVLVYLVVIQMVCVVGRPGVLNRVLRRLSDIGDDDATPIRRAGPRGRQGLHKWLQAWYSLGLASYKWAP